MRAASTAPMILRAEEGAIRGLRGRFPLPPEAGDDAEAQARWFLQTYADAFGLVDVAVELAADGVVERPSGKAIASFHRVAGGLAVVGSVVRVHIVQPRDVAYVVAALPDDVAVPTTPDIDGDQAIDRAIDALDLAAATGVIAGASELVIFNAGVVDGGRTTSQLAWQVALEVEDPPQSPLAWVDAASGALLSAADRQQSALQRLTYFADNRTDTAALLAVGGAELWLDENGPVAGAEPDQDGLDVHDLAQIAYDYYSAVHGRDGWDDRGSPILSFVHFHDRSDNAYFSQGAFWFMDGVYSRDIFVHELTHGVVSASSPLAYAREAGAINESFADVFAAFATPDGPEKWTFGEGVDWGADPGPIRDMRNPEAHGQPRHMRDFEALPADEAPARGNDHGGVHTNSGIPNFAAFLTTEGARPPQYEGYACGIGQEKAERIYYKALVDQYMPVHATFADLRFALDSACWELWFFEDGAGGVTANDCGHLLNALWGVGIGALDTDGDGFADDEDSEVGSYNPDQVPRGVSDSRACEPDFSCPPTLSFSAAVLDLVDSDATNRPYWARGYDFLSVDCTYGDLDSGPTVGFVVDWLEWPQSLAATIDCPSVGECEVACAHPISSLRSATHFVSVWVVVAGWDDNPDAQAEAMAHGEAVLAEFEGRALACP